MHKEPIARRARTTGAVGASAATTGGRIPTSDMPSAARLGRTFEDVARRRYSRRAFLSASGAALTAGALGVRRRAAVAQSAGPFGFMALAGPEVADDIAVAEGHSVDVVARWGDPLFADAPAFDAAAQTAAAQARQFGYNCDYIAVLPIDGQVDRSVLVVNHEYVNPELMFPHFDAAAVTDEQMRVEMMAHGVSVAEIVRDANGKWTVVKDSALNRRLTAETPIQLSGPAAGSPRLRTVADPSGQSVLGTLNNCAGGTTPWGTVLTAEENFQKYFANLAAPESAAAESAAADAATDLGPDARVHARYGMQAESDWGWERIDPRFDGRSEPNEAFRFGWLVEFDPLDPTSTPKKRTALGRFRHEGAATVVAVGGQVAVYSGDDDRFEYVYKFVTRQAFQADDRSANADLLDDGTLYVARFNEDGTGEWLALEHGAGPLTTAAGFASPADILIDVRSAADLVGATKMDRPEDIEVSPITGRVYVALTNNKNRGLEGFPPADAANPRIGNKFGHVLELTEADDDHAATRFRWDIFLLCGDPTDPETYFAGFDKAQVSAIASPDNLTFDSDGHLWIATDGQPDALGVRDGLFAVPTSGPDRGAVRRFLSAVPGAEVCGPAFSPDGNALFVAIQHPGEGGTFEAPASRWPDAAGPPRPSVISVRHVSGGRVGYGGSGSNGANGIGSPSDANRAAGTDVAGASATIPTSDASTRVGERGGKPASDSDSARIGVPVGLALGGAAAVLLAWLGRRRSTTDAPTNTGLHSD